MVCWWNLKTRSLFLLEFLHNLGFLSFFRYTMKYSRLNFLLTQMMHHKYFMYNSRRFSFSSFAVGNQYSSIDANKKIEVHSSSELLSTFERGKGWKRWRRLIDGSEMVRLSCESGIMWWWTVAFERQSSVELQSQVSCDEKFKNQNCLCLLHRFNWTRYILFQFAQSDSRCHNDVLSTDLNRDFIIAFSCSTIFSISHLILRKLSHSAFNLIVNRTELH